MSDAFQIIPPVIRAEGKDVPPEQIQAGFNSLARQTQLALNTVATDPTGPAGGDLSGTYPNPTVAAVHATSGTLDGVVIGGVTPAAGSFTTVSATTPVAVTSGGTGRNALTANAVVIGEGSSQVNFAAPGAAGGMLISQGAAADPAFANNPTITGGSVNGAPVGATTPSTGAFTTLSASSTVSGAGFTSLFASPPSIGNTAANSGAFTTLSATGAVSGAGFTARFSTPGPIGNTTPSTGAFTTLSSTGAFTPSSTNGIVGTTTNDNANAGSVGEYLTNSVGNAGITTGTATNVGTLSLTAGDWDVSGTVNVSLNATTVATAIQVGISTTSATQPGTVGMFTLLNVTFTTGAPTIDISTPVVRISVASTTSVFCVQTTTFGTSTASAGGFIRARRVR